MDFKECIEKKIIKDVVVDKNQIISIREIAQLKIESADFLPQSHFISKVSLYYDALREILESVALEKGYKIYNHECYSAFLKEILNESDLGDLFDKLRRIRNGINYYGQKVDQSEADFIISDIKKLIDYFK